MPALSPGLALVEELSEHTPRPVAGLFTVGLNADDLDFIADLDTRALDSGPGHNRAASEDREHVLDRHQERLVDVALGVPESTASSARPA
jgi:hypothetical protein